MRYPYRRSQVYSLDTAQHKYAEGEIRTRHANGVAKLAILPKSRMAALNWCRERESNPQAQRAYGPEPYVFANFTISASSIHC